VAACASAERHQLALLVGHLHTDGRTPRDGGQNPDVGGRHRIGDVALQVRHLGHLHARSELELVAGDRRADGRSRQPRFDAVGGQGGLEGVPQALDLPPVDLGGPGPLQERQRRQPPGARLPGRAEGDGELLGVGGRGGRPRARPPAAGPSGGCGPSGGTGWSSSTRSAGAAPGIRPAGNRRFGARCVAVGSLGVDVREVGSAHTRRPGFVGFAVVQVGPADARSSGRGVAGGGRPALSPAKSTGRPTTGAKGGPPAHGQAGGQPAAGIPGPRSRDHEQRQSDQGNQHHSGPRGPDPVPQGHADAGADQPSPRPGMRRDTTPVARAAEFLDQTSQGDQQDHRTGGDPARRRQRARCRRPGGPGAPVTCATLASGGRPLTGRR
jgi:hypothetical protein